MKKLSMILMLAFVCGSFAMAQTSNAAKQATLMPDGAVITDIKTGEVIRTTGAPIPVNQLQINGSINLTGGGNPTNVTPQSRLKPVLAQPANELIVQPGSGTNPTNPTGTSSQFINPANTNGTNTIVPAPASGSTQQGGNNAVTPNVNPKSNFGPN